MKTSYTDFAPRIGIAYSPNSKTVVRAGWGIFYNQEIGNAYFDLARNIAGRVTITSNPGIPNLFYSNAVPGGSGVTANVPSPFAYSMSVDHRTTYAMQYLFNIQQQLTSDWALEAGYLGTQSRHLQGFQDVNQAIPGTVGNIASRTPYPGFSNIQLVHDGGIGNYNSLTRESDAPLQPGRKRDQFLYLGEIDRYNQRNPQPGQRYPLSAEQLLSLMRTRAFCIRYTSSHGHVDSV